jgi:protein-histidine pros-kinase
MNLVSNAVKATEHGKVTVRPSKEGGGVRIAVEDTGCGISPQAMEYLFQPFSKVAARETGWQGTGLGLYLSGRIAELLGGRITVESEEGKGSVFSVAIGTPGEVKNGLPS